MGRQIGRKDELAYAVLPVRFAILILSALLCDLCASSELRRASVRKSAFVCMGLPAVCLAGLWLSALICNHQDSCSAIARHPRTSLQCLFPRATPILH